MCLVIESFLTTEPAMPKSIATYETAALDLMNAGFSSKAGQKAATDQVGRAYDVIRESLHNALLADRSIGGSEQAWKDLYYGVPLYVHQFSDKLAARYADGFAADVADALRLRDLRDAIKASAIVPPAKDETKARAARVVESIKALMDRRNAQFLEAIDLSEVVGDGIIIHGLTANSHYVTNEHGTTFLRTFFYLRGKLTPLNTILAGAEEAARRDEAA